MVINVHRFPTSGLITFLSRAREKCGFDKNPFAFCYTHKVTHEIGNGLHETQRNLQLIESVGEREDYKPRLYFSESDQRRIDDLVQKPYITIAPSSVWCTKQLPKEKWAELVKSIPNDITVCMIGSANDVQYCEEIIGLSMRENILNFSGKLRLLESAALMNGSKMNYSNDSAPMHISSSVNSPTTAFYCSTLPEFGFGPLSDASTICQTEEELSCRPCGLHGRSECPEGHFKCGTEIKIPSFIV